MNLSTSTRNTRAEKPGVLPPAADRRGALRDPLLGGGPQDVLASADGLQDTLLDSGSAANGAALPDPQGLGGILGLPAPTQKGLLASFGRLPPFEVTIAAGGVPAGARAASDAGHIYLREPEDAKDLRLVAHEVAHIVQLSKSGGQPSEGGYAIERIAVDGSIAAAELSDGDERGVLRAAAEDEADSIADVVTAEQTLMRMGTRPVVQGETYLQTSKGTKPHPSDVRLVLFPGEGTRSDKTTYGHLYVFVSGKLVATYEAVGGPPTSGAQKEGGGHTRGSTPEGEYSLDAAEHHTTKNWPASVVPWGAQIRENKGEIEYSVDGTNWKVGTGPQGTVTQSLILWEKRTRADAARAATRGTGHTVSPLPITDQEKNQLGRDARKYFMEGGVIMTTYEKNDFGEWAFNMRQRDRTAYYIHTTPDDEKIEKTVGQSATLTQSHGCVHIHPKDRKEMMDLGYLQKDVKMVVKPYGQVGP